MQNKTLLTNKKFIKIYNEHDHATCRLKVKLKITQPFYGVLNGIHIFILQDNKSKKKYALSCQDSISSYSKQEKERLWERLLVLKYADLKQNKPVARLHPNQSSVGVQNLGTGRHWPQVFDFCGHSLLCSHYHTWSFLHLPLSWIQGYQEGGASVSQF